MAILGICEVELEHAFTIGIITEAVDGVVGWDLALEKNVSDLDRVWQAVFVRFASVVCLVALFEQDGFGFASRRRMRDRFGAGSPVGVEEGLAVGGCGAGEVLVGSVARERRGRNKNEIIR